MCVLTQITSHVILQQIKRGPCLDVLAALKRFLFLGSLSYFRGPCSGVFALLTSFLFVCPCITE